MVVVPVHKFSFPTFSSVKAISQVQKLGYYYANAAVGTVKRNKRAEINFLLVRKISYYLTKLISQMH